MKEYKNDLRYTKTHETIQKTFRELLEAIPYDKISVKLLTEKARINRKTFYLHYDTLDELLHELGREIVSNGISQIQKYTIPQDLKKIIFTIYQYWQSLTADDAKIFRLSSSSANVFSFAQQMRNIFANFDSNFQSGDIEKQKAALAFIVNAMGVIYREWTIYHTVSTIEEAVDLAYALITNGINTTVKK